MKLKTEPTKDKKKKHIKTQETKIEEQQEHSSICIFI